MFYFKLRKTNRILKGSIWINGSKSESNRLLIIKNIYYNLINIENLSNSEDTKSLNKEREKQINNQKWQEIHSVIILK